ncbi:histidine tRS [Acrasis kona]|uniref:Histidine tRS n=1 Tax=Acrasis kona TaxID=1008807 RepID=A0AAW2YX07_9EUKA
MGVTLATYLAKLPQEVNLEDYSAEDPNMCKIPKCNEGFYSSRPRNCIVPNHWKYCSLVCMFNHLKSIKPAEWKAFVESAGDDDVDEDNELTQILTKRA